MESLAFVVSLMIAHILFSGPFVLLLTLSRVRSISSKLVFLVFRRVAMGIASFTGIFLSLIFIFNDLPFIIKALSLLCISAHMWAADREYGNFISSRLRRHG